MKERMPVMNVRNAAVALAVTAFSVSAYADWRDGWGVIRFAPATNPSQLIFSDQVYNAANVHTESGTDRYNYNSEHQNELTRTDRARYPSSAFVFGREFRFLRPDDALVIERIDHFSPTVINLTSRSSNPAACPKNGRGCASSGQTIGTSSCVTQTTSVTNGVNAAVDIPLPAPVNIGVSYQRQTSMGWSNCQQEAALNTCPGGNGVPFNNLTYATTETRSRFGWHKLSMPFSNDRGTIIVSSKSICDRFGGGYLEIGNRYCQLMSRRPTWERFIRTPIPESLAPAVVYGCRLIRDNS